MRFEKVPGAPNCWTCDGYFISMVGIDATTVAFKSARTGQHIGCVHKAARSDPTARDAARLLAKEDCEAHHAINGGTKGVANR